MVSTREYNYTYLLYLPEHEMHEISLLFSSYIIQSRNNKVIYLGQNVPYADLESVYKLHKPEIILTVLTTYPATNDAEEYIGKLSKDFPKSIILVSGYQIVGQDLKFPENVVVLNKLQDLINFVEEHNEHPELQ
jgi:hypothetical protein